MESWKPFSKRALQWNIRVKWFYDFREIVIGSKLWVAQLHWERQRQRYVIRKTLFKNAFYMA